MRLLQEDMTNDKRESKLRKKDFVAMKELKSRGQAARSATLIYHASGFSWLISAQWNINIFMLRSFIKCIKQGNWIHKMYSGKYKCSANKGSIRIIITVMSFSLVTVSAFVALSNLTVLLCTQTWRSLLIASPVFIFFSFLLTELWMCVLCGNVFS